MSFDVNVKRLGHIVEVVEVVHVQCRSKHRVSMHWYQRPFDVNKSLRTPRCQRIELGEPLIRHGLRGLLELEVLSVRDVIQPENLTQAIGLTSNSAPLMHLSPLSPAPRTIWANKPLGSASSFLPVSGTMKEQRKNGKLRSQGIRRNVERSTIAIKSLHPLALFETSSSCE